MAKIVQTLTRASREYREDVAQSFSKRFRCCVRKIKHYFSRKIKTGDRS